MLFCDFFTKNIKKSQLFSELIRYIYRMMNTKHESNLIRA